jgi:hypothetical protein
MSIPDDADPDVLISRLAGGLAPPDRAAFRRAAENAIEHLPCAGPGSIYRVVTGLWRSYFHPPEDASWDIAQDLPGRSKLASGPPVGRDDPRVGRRGWADRRSRL